MAQELILLWILPSVFTKYLTETLYNQLHLWPLKAILISFPVRYLFIIFGEGQKFNTKHAVEVMYNSIFTLILINDWRLICL